MGDGILIVNGSPRGEHSNTYRVTRALCDGILSARPQAVQTITVKELSVAPCRGCFGCWKFTDRKCVIQDDMRLVMEKILESETVIFSFPVYFFGIPGPLKTVIDRLLPFMQPYDGGPVLHRARLGVEKKHFLFVSTCGFQSTDGIYDALLAQIRCLFGETPPPLVTVPQAELLPVEQLHPIIEKRFGLLRQAGRQFAEEGSVSPDLLKQISARLIPLWAYQKAVSPVYPKEPDPSAEE